MHGKGGGEGGRIGGNRGEMDLIGRGKRAG